MEGLGGGGRVKLLLCQKVIEAGQNVKSEIMKSARRDCKNHVYY